MTDELAALFEKQYTLATEVIIETRYRIETREGTRSYTDPETGETVTETYFHLKKTLLFVGYRHKREAGFCRLPVYLVAH